MAVDYDKKLVYIQDVEVGNARPFNVSQVKKYQEPADIAHSFTMGLRDKFDNFATPPEDESVYMTEIIDVNDPRSCSKKMDDAKRSEIRNLLQRGTFKVILREELPPDGNILPGRFVLAIKSTEDG